MNRLDLRSVVYFWSFCVRVVSIIVKLLNNLLLVFNELIIRRTRYGILLSLSILQYIINYYTHALILHVKYLMII